MTLTVWMDYYVVQEIVHQQEVLSGILMMTAATNLVRLELFSINLKLATYNLITLIKIF